MSFDHSPEDETDRELADPRFLLRCFNRCFCNYRVTDLTIQPKRDEPSDADTRDDRMSSETGEIRLDVTESEDLRTAERYHDGRLGDVAVDSV